MSGVYDNTASTGNIAVLETAWATGASVAVVVYPEGNTSTKPTYTFSAIFTGFDFSDPVDDMVQWTSEWQISGDVTKGAVS